MISKVISNKIIFIYSDLQNQFSYVNIRNCLIKKNREISDRYLVSLYIACVIYRFLGCFFLSDECKQNYLARNAKFTGAVHKNVIPSACCEWGGRIGSCAYIVGAYCARGKTMRTIVSHDACGRPGKKRTEKKARGQAEFTTIQVALVRRYFPLRHLPR